jgi:hypothetical protein
MVNRRAFLASLAVVPMAARTVAPSTVAELFGVDYTWDGDVEDPMNVTAVYQPCGCYQVTRGKLTEHYGCETHVPMLRDRLQRVCVFQPSVRTRMQMRYS